MVEESGKDTSELEQLGQETLDAAERLEQSIQEVYAEIPETENLEDFEKMAEELRETAGKLAKAGTQVFTVSDELSTRCRDTRQQRRKRRAEQRTNLTDRQSENFHECFLLKILNFCLITNLYH